MKKLALIVAVFAGYAGSLQAADVSYDHVGLSFIQTEIDNSVLEPSGIELHLSKLLTDSIYLKAMGNTTSASSGDVKLQGSSAELGVGYRAGVLDSVDVFTELSYMATTSKVKGSSSISDEGYGLAIGSRMAFTHELNADLLVRRSEYSDADGLTELGLNLRYAFKSIDIMGQVTSSSDQNKWGVGLQYKF